MDRNEIGKEWVWEDQKVNGMRSGRTGKGSCVDVKGTEENCKRERGREKGGGGRDRRGRARLRDIFRLATS